MTDVYISYARDDRDKVRPMAEALQAQGWEVWWDADGLADSERALAAADVVLVVWSAAARGSEHVRAEAATGLYRNRLVQARIDSATAPRPFDQVEVMDVGAWSGDTQDIRWRAVVAAVRLLARPIAMTTVRSAVGSSLGARKPAPAPAAGPPAGVAIAAAVAIAVAGAGTGAWFLNPFGWKSALAAPAEKPVAAPKAGTQTAAAHVALPTVSAEADAVWVNVAREDPVALRDFLILHAGTTAAEAARSVLRVLDAKAWADAVIADTEVAYASYLKSFPANASTPGAMAAGARDRLASLGAERQAAIADMQRSLLALGVYSGKIDGQPDDGTAGAVKKFAASIKRPPPELAAAAPRDLRSFGDLARAEATKTRASSLAASAAGDASPPRPARDAAPAPRGNDGTDQPALAASEATAAADAADRLRLEMAEKARLEAERGAQDLALAELARGQAVQWTQAIESASVAAYQSYLAAYPGGPHAVEARKAIEDLSRAPAFSVEHLAPDVRRAVEAARDAETDAKARASEARKVAAAADDFAELARKGQPGAETIIASDGDRFEAQIANGAPNGFGVRLSGDDVSKGDRYRGEIRGGLAVGLGVYEFAQNPNNAQAGALRYEGEHVRDEASGLGVTVWRNGDSFAGQTLSGPQGAGVLSYANGQRYDGEMSNGTRNGLGVVWSATGEAVMAGRWQDGLLVEKMATE